MDFNIEEIIVRVLQNTVSEEEMHFFSEWIHLSDENKKLFFELKNIYDYRKGDLYLDGVELETGWNRLWAKLQKSKSKDEIVVTKKKSILFNRWKIATTAAVAGFLIWGVTLFYIRQETSVTWVEVHNPACSLPKTIHLPDGSWVQLNASSYLRYPKKFKNEERKVYLDGEALFNVIKQENKLFIVHSNKQQINVLGTRFNVMDYSTDAYSVTTLISGKVQLETFDEEKNLRDRIVMSPEQQLRFDAYTGQITLNQTDTHEVISWTNGIYSFQDVPLQQITDRLSKMYGVTIIVTDKESRAEKYTGKFSSNQSIEEVMRIINFHGEFRTIFSNDSITIALK